MILGGMREVMTMCSGNIFNLTETSAIEELGGSHDREHEQVRHGIEHQGIRSWRIRVC